MSIFLRIVLILCALFVLLFIVRRLRKAEMSTGDTIFWILFAFVFVLISVFPQIAFFFSDLLGIESPSNFVFLFVVAALFIREFNSTITIAKLREKVTALAQEIALEEYEQEKGVDKKNNES